MAMTPAEEKLEAERYMVNVNLITKAFGKIGMATMVHLIHAREESTEAGIRAAQISGGGSSASETTATEAAALSGLPDGENDKDDWRRHVVPDPLGEAIAHVLTGIVEIARLTKQVDRRVSVVVHAADKLAGRPTTLDQCQCCDKDVQGRGRDRIVSGYCPACYKAWCKAGRPDRLLWEVKRRSWLADAGRRMTDDDAAVKDVADIVRPPQWSKQTWTTDQRKRLS